jgi:hypothetical protein
VLWICGKNVEHYITIFKEIEKNNLLRELMVFATNPSISTGSKCFQWGNKKQGGAYVNNYIKHHETGQGTGNVVTSSTK